MPSANATTVVSIPCGPSLAVKEAAWGLACYAAIAQDNGLVPIREPEILFGRNHPIERTLEVAENVWGEVFYYLAQNSVVIKGILLKPSMVTPGAEHKEKASPETIAKFTLQFSEQEGGYHLQLLESWCCSWLRGAGA